jgi:hypothetical protein
MEAVARRGALMWLMRLATKTDFNGIGGPANLHKDRADICGTFRGCETDGHSTCKRPLPLPRLQAPQLRDADKRAMRRPPLSDRWPHRP